MHLRNMALLLFVVTALPGQTIDGEWVVKLKFFDNTEYRRMTLHLQDAKLTGKAGDLDLEGTLRGGKVEIQGKNEGGGKATLSGALKNGQMSGEATWRGEKMQWTASRPKPRPAAAARHVFEPKEFHRLFSGSIPPALTLYPGDSVKTWSVDAGGWDASGVRRSLGGNPETGPFYIEGALPGDTLVVRFERLRLNRDTAISSGSIALEPLSESVLSVQSEKGREVR